MASLNKAILIGHMVRDPELKTTPSGVSVCSFSIGITRRFKDASGQYPSDFINIVAWRQQAEFISKYFKKGNAICIVGSIQTRNYTDQQGNKRYVTEVVADEASFVDKKSENSGNQSYQYTPPAEDGAENAPKAPAYSTDAEKAPKFEEVSGDEDLPF